MFLVVIFQNNVFQNLRISAVSIDGMVKKRHVGTCRLFVIPSVKTAEIRRF